MTLQAPFPWFGGKSRASSLIWERFGDTPNYVEPFAGSLAVLLGRPAPGKIETVNDLDGFIANFWRAIKADPERTAHYADLPVFENDLHARHAYLVNIRARLTRKLEGDPNYYDAQIAGWWAWGVCTFIGGFCDGKGPWRVVDGELVKAENPEASGVARSLPHLGDGGKGINRSVPQVGNAGNGVNRSLPHFSDSGTGDTRPAAREALLEWFRALSDRLRNVRVASGDWTRVMGESVTIKHGLTAVLLDPPYATERDTTVYAFDSTAVAHAVRQWAIENGDNPLYRIALCGYEDEHEMPAGWVCVPWKARGGYQKGEQRERIWFSPHCLQPQAGLFGEVAA